METSANARANVGTPAPTQARTVVGGVGYRNLRDHSLGIVMSDELESAACPPSLLVEDLCYGPVAVAQWLLDEAREAPVTRIIFVTAIAREDGRPPGTICAYRWNHALPNEELIQQAVVDAVTGVIFLDNTLIVTEWMQALPAEVFVVEVEPLEHAFGDEMSAAVATAYPVARALVMRIATDEVFAQSLPVAALGGGVASERPWATLQ